MIGFFGGSVDWTDMVVSGGIGSGNTQTMPFSGSLTASVADGGFGQLYYIKNGAAPVAVSGAISVASGDTIQWGYQTKGSLPVVASIYNGAALLDTFNIVLGP